MIRSVSPDAPALVRDGAAAILALVAVGSALGQPRLVELLPAPARQLPIVLAPVVAIVVVMVFWLVKVNLAGRGRRRAGQGADPTDVLVAADKG